MGPDVSIVLCTHNRPDLLREALASLVAQETHGKFTFEIVVIHTNSPGTLEVVEELSREAGFPVRPVFQSHRGQVVARNRGLAEARGEWIANFDDDQVASPCWLRELWETAHEKRCRSVGGALRLRLPAGCQRRFTPLVERVLGATVNWDTVRPYTRREGPGSGNQMIHRSVFEELGTYDPSFTLRGYDTDMYRRMRMAGVESWFNPRASGEHVIPAERLNDSFFRETSLHNGWSFARRDRLERGRLANLVLAAARLAQALLVGLPRLAWTRWGGDPERLLDARIRLWRAQGYLRSTLYWLAPRWFPQEQFFARHEFRAEKRFPPAKQEATA